MQERDLQENHDRANMPNNLNKKNQGVQVNVNILKKKADLAERERSSIGRASSINA
jgi:hypothetical protein